jgi:hypothetical protein
MYSVFTLNLIVTSGCYLDVSALSLLFTMNGGPLCKWPQKTVSVPCCDIGQPGKFLSITELRFSCQSRAHLTARSPSVPTTTALVF